MIVYVGGNQHNDEEQYEILFMDVCNKLESSIIENLTPSIDTWIMKSFAY